MEAESFLFLIHSYRSGYRHRSVVEHKKEEERSDGFKKQQSRQHTHTHTNLASKQSTHRNAVCVMLLILFFLLSTEMDREENKCTIWPPKERRRRMMRIEPAASERARRGG